MQGGPANVRAPGQAPKSRISESYEGLGLAVGLQAHVASVVRFPEASQGAVGVTPCDM